MQVLLLQRNKIEDQQIKVSGFLFYNILKSESFYNLLIFSDYGSKNV